MQCRSVIYCDVDGGGGFIINMIVHHAFIFSTPTASMVVAILAPGTTFDQDFSGPIFLGHRRIWSLALELRLRGRHFHGFIPSDCGPIISWGQVILTSGSELELHTTSITTVDRELR